MRISDWSSDVCSSDLGGGLFCSCPAAGLPPFKGGWPMQGRPARGDGTGMNRKQRRAQEKIASKAVPGQPAMDPADRKSGVEGKSVSVRVDLGGTRIIQKKTKIRTHRIRKLKHI